MSLVCTLCKNKNEFTYFAKYYKDTSEEIRNKDLLHFSNKISLAHLVCACFFPELDLEEVNAQESAAADIQTSDQKNLFMGVIICNGKKIRENVMEDCSICRKPINGYLLIQCLVKGCKNLFHYHCTKNRNNIQRVKMEKEEDSKVKYGFICPAHTREKGLGRQITWRFSELKFMGNLDETKLVKELAEYEDIFARSLVMKQMEITSGQFPQPSLENSAEKNDEKLVTETNNELKGGQEKTRFDQGQNQSKDEFKTFEYDTFGDFYTMDSDDESLSQKRLASKYEVDKGNGQKQEEEKNRKLEMLEKIMEEIEEECDLQDENDKNTHIEKQESQQITEITEDSNNIATKHSEISFIHDSGLGFEMDQNNESTTQSSHNTIEESLPLEKQVEEAIQPILKPQKPIKFLGSKLGRTGQGKVSICSKMKKQKSKSKSTANGEQPYWDEETKKAFWVETLEIFHRKPTLKDLDTLKHSMTLSIPDMIRSETRRAYVSLSPEAKRNFNPKFTLEEISNGVLTQPKKILTAKQKITKVLFELVSNQQEKDKIENFNQYTKNSFLATFYASESQAAASAFPDNLDNCTDLTKEDNSKYNILMGDKPQEIRNQFYDSLRPLTNKSRFKYCEQSATDEDLEGQELHRLLKLRNVNFIGSEELIELKSKALLRKELSYVENEVHRDNSEIDDITKELIYFNFLLNQFVVPENNTRKERLICRTKEDDQDPKITIRLIEKAKNLDSDLRFGVIKKYLRMGLKDKNEQSISHMYAKNNEAISYYGLAPPKPQKAVGNKRRNTSTIRSKDMQARNNLDSTKKESNALETDCCICFHYYSNDNNPIIYCSGCDVSFHQYCYGLPKLPDGDFYCDACLHLRVQNKSQSKAKPSLKKSEIHYSNTKDKPEKREENHANALRCKLCKLDEFPLKKFQKSEWYHITCLLFYNKGYFYNGEFFLDLEKSTQNSPAPSQILEAKCRICKRKGLCIKCQNEECKKFFHGLCAYLEGYQIELLDVKDIKDNKFGGNLVTEFWCPRHSPDRKRDCRRQKYYRRFATNYNKTCQYQSFESFIKALKEEKENRLTRNIQAILQEKPQEKVLVCNSMNVQIKKSNTISILIDEKEMKRKGDIIFDEDDAENEISYETEKKVKMC